VRDRESGRESERYSSGKTLMLDAEKKIDAV
jgi:hypothetical protein